VDAPPARDRRPSSLDSRRRPKAEARLLAKWDTPGLKPHEAAASILRADPPNCPRHAGYYAIQTEGEQKAAAIRCKSWACPWCARFKHLASYAVLASGIALAQSEGRAVRFVTITDNEARRADVASFKISWRKFAQRLQVRDLLGEYARSLETTKRGALHLHVLMAEADRGGGFIEQKELSKMAEASGFGRITDIRLVAPLGEPRQLAAYLTAGKLNEDAKALARYCSKRGAETLAEKSKGRIRPLSLSRSWPGGGIRAAEAELMEHWYGKNSDTDFEVWNKAEVHWQTTRLRAMDAAAARLAA